MPRNYISADVKMGKATILDHHCRTSLVLRTRCKLFTEIFSSPARKLLSQDILIVAFSRYAWGRTLHDVVWAGKNWRVNYVGSGCQRAWLAAVRLGLMAVRWAGLARQ
jgi:hypothetical protein